MWNADAVVLSTTEAIDVGGRQRTYTVVGPGDGVRPTAVVIIYHGSNQTGSKLRKFSGHIFDRLATKNRAVVTYPDGYKGHWNDARISTNFAARTEGYDDVAFTEGLIERLTAQYKVDPGKVYVVGFSLGGQMVIRLIHQSPRRLAGAGIISATQPAPENFALVNVETVGVPVVLLHGTRDPLVPYGGGMASLWGF